MNTNTDNNNPISDLQPSPPQHTEDALVQPIKKISAIWLLPIISVIIGVWIVVNNIQNQGPDITIRLNTADGIEADKTKIKALSVEVGIVKSVALNEDFSGVIIQARLDKNARELLKEDTRFWVVRPRVGREGISGLSTLLSGAYIELAPGESEQSSTDFTALDDIPNLSEKVKGKHVILRGDNALSLSEGDPVLHRGFNAGEIENISFNVEDGLAYYKSVY